MANTFHPIRASPLTHEFPPLRRLPTIGPPEARHAYNYAPLLEPRRIHGLQLPVEHDSTIDVSEPYVSPPVTPKPTVRIPPQDADAMWLKAVKTSLSVYTLQELNKAATFHGYTAKHDAIAGVAKDIQDGHNPSLMPPLDYVWHFTLGNRGPGGLHILKALSIKNLGLLASRCGFDPITAVLMSTDALAAKVHAYERILSMKELEEMPLDQLKSYLRARDISLNSGTHAKRAGSRQTLIASYVKHHAKAGDIVPVTSLVPLKSQPIALVAGRLPPQIEVHSFATHCVGKDAYTVEELMVKNFMANGKLKPYATLAEMIPVHGDDIVFNILTIADMIVMHQYAKIKGADVYIIEYLMVMTTDDIDALLHTIGFSGFVGSRFDKIHFLWLMYTMDTSDGVSESMRRITHASTDQLVKVTGAKDSRVKLLWKLVFHATIDITDVSRCVMYQQLLYKSPTFIMNCCRYMYRYFSRDILSLYEPYGFLSLVSDGSRLELFIEALGTTSPETGDILTCEDLVSQSGNFMMFPPRISTTKEVYFLENVSSYEAVFSRTTRLAAPAGEQLKSQLMLCKILSTMTDTELMEIYHFEGVNWTSRNDLLVRLVALISATQPTWSFISNPSRSKNPRYSWYELEDRSFDDPMNPIISFGDMFQYRSYSTSELDGAFTPDDNHVVHFYNPLYTSKSSVCEGFQDTMQEFDMPSMVQLLSLLKGEQSMLPMFKTIISNIETGIAETNHVSKAINILKRSVMMCGGLASSSFEGILVQMFIMSMYARFWKGPGFPYPLKWRDRGDHIVEEETRDRNYTLAGFKLRELLAAADPRIRKIFTGLLVINYVWSSGNVYLTRENYSTLFEDSAKSQMCLADMSDRGLQTAYYLLTSIFDLKEAEINQRIAKAIHCLVQPLFIAAAVDITGHVDPNHRRDIVPNPRGTV